PARIPSACRGYEKARAPALVRSEARVRKPGQTGRGLKHDLRRRTTDRTARPPRPRLARPYGKRTRPDGRPRPAPEKTRRRPRDFRTQRVRGVRRGEVGREDNIAGAEAEVSAVSGGRGMGRETFGSGLSHHPR